MLLLFARVSLDDRIVGDCGGGDTWYIHGVAGLILALCLVHQVLLFRSMYRQVQLCVEVTGDLPPPNPSAPPNPLHPLHRGTAVPAAIVRPLQPLPLPASPYGAALHPASPVYCS